MELVFIQLASALVIASVLGIVAKRLKQPLILAYIVTGIIISVFALFSEYERPVFDLMANIGIAFLLFLVGVELRIDDLKYVGKASLLTGLGQILFTALVGFIIVSALGFSFVPAIYIAVALTFSSTVIIVKLLTEKHQLSSLHGKIAIGFLLVQDFVAIIALMFLSGFGPDTTPNLGGLALILAKGILLLGAVYVASKTILKFFFKLTASSVELLFISAIAWAFLLSAIAEKIGFSIAIGAFLAGVAIASSPYRLQISARVKPLRDFFIVIFFILLGETMVVGTNSINFAHIILLSLFILIGNPLIVLAIMLPLGFRNRTAFLSSVTVAQISEFSLILMTVGLALGHVTNEMVGMVAGVGIVTITISSYMILYGEKIYSYIAPAFSKFFPEKHKGTYVVDKESLKDHVVLVGAEQMGWDILEFLKNKYHSKKSILVVDFSPEVFKTLSASGYNAVFGDIGDPEVLEELSLGKAKVIIITDPDVGDNIQLIKFAKEKNFTGPIICTAYWIHDAITLYENGADYVVVPEDVGGKHVNKIIGDYWDNLKTIKKQKSKNFEALMSRKIF